VLQTLKSQKQCTEVPKIFGIAPRLHSKKFLSPSLIC
jgi:hypothetical protein